MSGEKILGQVDGELEAIENKGQFYLLNLARRFVKFLYKPLEPRGISLILKITPSEKISVLDFEKLIEETFEETKFDINNLVLESKQYGAYRFNVNLNYDLYEDRFVEINDESKEDLGEDISLENLAKSVTLEITPKNEEQVSEKNSHIFSLVLKASNKIIKNLTKRIRFEAKFILEVKYKKNKVNKLEILKNSVKDISESYKVYLRRNKTFDKINVSMDFDDINDSEKTSKLIRKLK